MITETQKLELKCKYSLSRSRILLKCVTLFWFLQIAYYRSILALWTSSWRTRTCAKCKTCTTYRTGLRTSKQTTFSSALVIQRYFKTGCYNMQVIKSSLGPSLMTICRLMSQQRATKSERLHPSSTKIYIMLSTFLREEVAGIAIGQCSSKHMLLFTIYIKFSRLITEP